MLTSKQRAQLRGMANSYETILQIGKTGITEQTIKQIDDALTARELIKIRTLETSPKSSRQSADEVAERVGADVVQVIGSRIILYRESKDNKQIYLVK
ncbi:MAG: ribosome assembly RNA-binding protein YhbY [Clostridiales bacterium]|nr:ribosome assembly RNA-binding protein YhbY [Candidatus Equinaster intestinalis]